MLYEVITVSQAEKARKMGCELAVFSELTLCGYPPQDLLERPAFLIEHDKALRSSYNFV